MRRQRVKNEEFILLFSPKFYLIFWRIFGVWRKNGVEYGRKRHKIEPQSFLGSGAFRYLLLPFFSLCVPK